MSIENSAGDVVDTNSTTEGAQKHKSTDITITISRKSLKLAGIFSGAILLALILFFVVNATSSSKLMAAVEECGLSGSPYVSLDENGAGLYLDGEGEESVGLPYSDEGCVLTFLEVPSSILDRMGSTTAMMGVQEAEFNGISASWAYHPDNGFDINFSVN
jgi:hypothetical protein